MKRHRAGRTLDQRAKHVVLAPGQNIACSANGPGHMSLHEPHEFVTLIFGIICQVPNQHARQAVEALGQILIQLALVGDWVALRQTLVHLEAI